MEVKIKKTHPAAVIPSYSKPGDAGLDLTAVERTTDEYGNYVYRTGLAVEIPQGFVGLIFPRSSICKKTMLLTNHVGVIDSSYRGEIAFKFKDFLHRGNNAKTHYYEVGERIGQLIILPYPSIELKEVNELSETERGEGGFGSSGT